MKKIIAVISFSSIEEDSRVKRQINLIKKSFEVITVGYGPYLNSFEHLEVKKNCNILQKILFLFLIITKNHKAYFNLRFEYNKVKSFLQKHKVSCYLLNDSNSWPLIKNLESNRCIIDAHEYSLEEFSDRIYWRLFIKPLKIFASKFIINVNTRFSVEENICSKWEKVTKKNFKLLRNFSNFEKIKWKKNYDNNFKIIHHGIADPSRKIENMIYAIGKSGKNYKGYFYLKTSNKKYLNYLKRISKLNNVEILDPISEDLLIAEGNKYDLAILSIYPSNFNYKYCLPNKLFQFIQSRIGIVTGPTPSIANIVNKYKIGKVSKSFSINDLKNAIKDISIKENNKMKKNCDLAALELSWEKEQKILLKAVKLIAGN